MDAFSLDFNHKLIATSRRPNWRDYCFCIVVQHNVEPQIYVACLAAYNSGILHGRWIDANQAVDDLQAEIQEMLKDSPIDCAEEWAIHDYDDFHGANLCEYTSLAIVSGLASLLVEHGKIVAEVYNYYSCLNATKEALEDHYCGVYDSVADFAREMTEQTTEIPKNIAFYIDYEAMGRDMDYSGDIIVIECNGNCHIFWNH